MSVYQLNPPMETFTGTLGNVYVFVGGKIDLSKYSEVDQAKIVHFLNRSWGVTHVAQPEESPSGEGSLAYAESGTEAEEQGSREAEAGDTGDDPHRGLGVEYGDTQYIRTFDRIRGTILAMDAEDDNNWTMAGLPRIDILSKLLQTENLTRQDVDHHSSGLTRDQVREHQNG